jgi:anti-anti-sigma regulatory factor
MALRISVETSPATHATSLCLEGSVGGPWVKVLQTACADALSINRQVVLDLGRVSFIDPAGILALRDLMSEGIRLINCSPFTSLQLNTSPQVSSDNVTTG